MPSDRTVVVVQARMSSTRFPGKVLAQLAGEPAIVRMIERVRRIRSAEHCLVATSIEPSDDQLATLCGDRGIACVRGSLDDVLARFVAAVPDDCETVVRLTGDCPLVDPALVERHIERFASERPWADYVSNAIVRTYPNGLDVEVMSRDVLLAAHRHARSAWDREHVTPWIQRHARQVPITQDIDLSALRLVLDTPEDYAVLAGVYAALYADTPDFDTRDVYRVLLSRPDLILVQDNASEDDQIERMGKLLAEETTP